MERAADSPLRSQPSLPERALSLPRLPMLSTQTFTSLALLLTFGVTPTEANDGGMSFSSQPRQSTVKKHAKWMSRLPENTSLSRLLLPGTHDSCALHDGFSFGFAKCQTWKLADQLDAGIRFIDIRCRHVGNKLLIYHGVIDQRTTFKEVRNVCREFLTQNPTECIVMSVKEESTAQDISRSFADTFADEIKNDGALWHISRKIPQLSSVRNRIVLVDRVGTLSGLKWSEMELQDHFNAPVELKAKLIRSHLEKASKTEGRKWFINFCSGTLPGRLITPRDYASKSNAVTLQFLKESPPSSPVPMGIIVMDFPGEALIERIVEMNFANETAN